jgi:hypothetical protein
MCAFERLLLPLAAADPTHVAHQCRQLCVGEEGAVRRHGEELCLDPLPVSRVGAFARWRAVEDVLPELRLALAPSLTCRDMPPEKAGTSPSSLPGFLTPPVPFGP